MNKRCKKLQKKLILYAYDDLSTVEKSELELHLTTCSHCRQTLEEIYKLSKIIPQKPLYTPTEKELCALRKTVDAKLDQKQQKQVFSFTFLAPKPVYQIGFVLFLIAFGFLLGRQTLTPSKDTSYQALLAANKMVQTQNSAINPVLASVERLTVDPKSGEIEISYNTVNDIKLRGNLENPAIRHVLKSTLLEEQSPAVRLHAIKAIGSFAESEKTLNADLISGIEKLLETEKNPGIRLLAVRILKMLPMNSHIQNIFLNILLYDQNTPMRMQALEALADAEFDSTTKAVLHTARQDSNSYIRLNAQNLLQSRQKQSIKIERKGYHENL